MFSSKSKNALKILIHLAQRKPLEYIPLREISEAEDVSLKYIEQIMPQLVNGNYVDVKHGKQGGYRLKKDPNDINVWEILVMMETFVLPVAELGDPKEENKLGSTLKMWEDFAALQEDYFKKITIASLAKIDYVPDYVI